MNDDFCARLADLITIKANMSIQSTSWEPFIKYVTPQCGEHRAHKPILEKYDEIISSIVEKLEDETY